MGDIKSDALRIVLTRRRTEKQTAEALIKKGYSAEEAWEAAAYYRENGYIDHEDFAARFAHDAAVLKGHGPVRISRDLLERGIEKEIIEATLSEIEFDVAPQMERRFGTGSRTHAEIQKIYQHFMRKGFTSGAIYKALDALYTYE